MSLSRREYEDFKTSIDKVVYKYVTRERSTIVSLISHAINSGTEKRKLEEKLSGYVDKNLAYKLADKAFSTLDGLGIKSKISRKRSFMEEEQKEVKKPRMNIDESANSEIQTNNEVKEDIVNSIRDLTPGQLQAQQIKDLMLKAQATIEQRKKAISAGELQLPVSNGTSIPMPIGSSIPQSITALQSSDVSSRIAMLQARIRNQLGTSHLQANPFMPKPEPPGLMARPTLSTPYPLESQDESPAASESSKPTPLILDSEGRTVDTTGKEVHLTLRVPTLKANIRAKKREEFKQQFLEKPTEEPVQNQFFDYRVASKPFAKVRRPFKFNEPGKFIQLGQRERAKSRLEKLQEQISQVARKTGISSAAKLAQLETRELSVSSDIVPDIEWWDAIILENDRYPVEGEPVKIKEDFITSLVEHPMEMKYQIDVNKPAVLQVFLTKKERKKLRRMNRRETWKEKQEKIRLGLEPPPEPKVRMANLMRVLGTEAVIDPTKMERHVREQMAKRLKAHEDANAARKLTPDQRRQKNIDKIKGNASDVGVHVAIYRVTDLSNGSHKFKIETNAQQLYMTGTVVLFKDVNVVVVEGGLKQQKKYKRLMMERIKWAEESRSKCANQESKCQLIWDGIVQERSFGEIQFKSCPSETFARDHFKKHGVEHYWDLSYGRKVLEEAEEGL